MDTTLSIRLESLKNATFTFSFRDCEQLQFFQKYFYASYGKL